MLPKLITLAENFDVRSTAAYGFCYIIASMTVTNVELLSKALAEKGMTVEQFEKLSELQCLSAKDENGDISKEEVTQYYLFLR